jgi:hypothetical protein
MLILIPEMADDNLVFLEYCSRIHYEVMSASPSISVYDCFVLGFDTLLIRMSYDWGSLQVSAF